MTKLFDENKIRETDNLIKLALKEEMSSLTASESLANDTIAKCKAEIQKYNGMESNNRFIVKPIIKYATPFAAGLLALVLIFNVPNILDSTMSDDNASPESLLAIELNGEGYTESNGHLAAADDQPVNTNEISSDILREEQQDELVKSFGLKDYNPTDSGPLSMDSLQQQNPNDYSVFLGNLFVSLDHSGTDEFFTMLLMGVFGPANNESMRIIDDSDYSHNGMTVRTLEYDGLTITISGAEGFSIDNIELTHERYATFRGISTGMTIQELKLEYQGISIYPDGRTDPENCSYSLSDNPYYLKFEVEEGEITRIRYYVEND